MLTSILALIIAYLIGSLPLGSALIKWSTGKSAQTFSAHNLGVENLLYFIGAPVAFASFFLDIFKAFVALALFAGNPWAALGVYVGHLYPIPLFPELPRGRGNGVLLGMLAAWWAFGTLALVANGAACSGLCCRSDGKWLRNLSDAWQFGGYACHSGVGDVSS